MTGLPVGWSQCTLQDVGEIVTGNTPPKSNAGNYGDRYPWVKPPDLGSDTPITTTAEKLSEEGAQRARLVPKGTTLVSCIGILGKVGISGATVATNQQINSVVFNSSLVVPQYGFFYCKTLKPWLDENSSSTTVAIINKRRFSEAPFILPPLNEQGRIVAKLEKLLSRVNTTQERLATIPRILKRFRQSALADACSGRLTRDWRKENRYVTNSDLLTELEKTREHLWNLRLQKKNNRNGGRSVRMNTKYKRPFKPEVDYSHEFPETWAIVTVSQLALLDVGFAFKSSQFETTGIRLLRGENIEPGSLRWKDVRFWPEAKLNGHEHLLIEQGEIILAMDRPLISTGLKIARAKSTDLPCLLVQRVTRFRMVERRMTDFLYYNLQLNEFVETLSAGLTGSDLPHITGMGLAKYTIGLPPLDEQEEIVRRVEALFKTADALEARYLKAKAHVDKLTQSILAKAFRGELVPQDPNDEPASVLLSRITGGPNGSASVKRRSRT